MIIESKMIIDNVDCVELARYLAIMIPEEEIEQEGLNLVIPRRKKNRTRKITINYLRNKKNDQNWSVARKPGTRQKKKMLALAISSGVQVVMSGHTYRVGDTCYLQTEGGAIGLELTGAVSRAFMMKWDKLYLTKAKTAGITMGMYKRYVDDSNQLVKVSPPGSKYNENTGKLVVDDQNLQENMEDDRRMAEIVKDVANTVMDGIQMEADYPSSSVERKMSILDMKVWMGSCGNVLYQHYEKAMASKLLLHAQSAQSNACKGSVHAMELVRRMLNTSPRLDWTQYVAPTLTEYMARMKKADYGEKYRKNTLVKSLAIYDKMRRNDEQGEVPLNRPRQWRKSERTSKKQQKKKTWSSKGGCIAPIFVPATPQGELVTQLREIAEKETETQMKFRFVEYGGRTVKSKVQKSNPTANPGCNNGDCLACQNGGGQGGNCLRSNVLYELGCNLCSGASQCVYIGETSRNLYTRGKEHIGKYLSQKQNNESFIKKHQIEKHNDLPADFSAKVVDTFKDCLTRQISEGIHLRRSNVTVLNAKSEWHQPPLWSVQSEIVRD